MRKRVKGIWFLSIWTIIVAVVMFSVGVVLGPDSGGFKGLMNIFVFPTSKAIYAIFLFSIAYASYRGLIIRGIESAIFMVGVVIMLLYNAPVAQLVWPSLQPLGDWLINVGATATMTSLTIGLGVALAIAGIRIIFGRERAVLQRGSE